MSGYPGPYEAYLIEFHATRDYFECHELLEDYWKSLPADEPGRDVWVGLIQIAVAQYHHRRGKSAGALKMFRQAVRRLDTNQLARLGLDEQALPAIVIERIETLEREGEFAAFREFDLPIRDLQLLAKLQDECRERGLAWGAASPADETLVWRHTLRDRSGVIAARAAAAIERQKQKRERQG